MELIRTFVRETPRDTGIIVAGRAHFFDNDREMETALGLGPGHEPLLIGEFTENQVAQFLGRREAIAEWLPSRPLLLAYLAARNLLTPALVADTGSDPASGWDSLLQRIANRESEFEAGIDPDTVRRLIEHISMLARNSVDGLGPLSADAIIGAFNAVCGYPPDDRGAVLLQRLPGLGAYNAEDGSRVFIDKDFVEAARGGALFRIIENPYEFRFDSETWQSTVRPLAAEVASYLAMRTAFPAGKISAAMRHLLTQHQAYTAACDLEKRTGERDQDWPSWYAEYMKREQSGEEPPL